jgi:ribonuclease HI
VPRATTPRGPDLSRRLQRLLADSERQARPSHILRAIESAAVDLSDHAQENLSDLIEWLQEAEALAQAGKLGKVTASLEKGAKAAARVAEEEAGESPEAAEAKPSKTRRPEVSLIGPPKVGTVPIARLFIDGGARGNPGPSAIALVMEDEDKEVVWTHAEAIGDGTNNWAEYVALIRGLTGAKRLGVHEIDVFSDAELIVKQVRGEYRVKHPALMPLWEEARNLTRQFARFRIAHIPRAKNRVADRLVNQALDGALGGT